MLKLDPKYDEVRKVYYSMGEVSVFLGVKRSTLTKWENTFGYPKCVRKKNNHRKFTMSDIYVFQIIQNLLVDYNVNGAKRIFPEKLDELKAMMKSGQLGVLNQIKGDVDVTKAA